MIRADELIAKFAPRGVTVSHLGQFAELVRGNGMPKTDLRDEGVGAIHYGQIYTRYGTWADSTISFVEPETAARLTKAAPGDIIITNTSENLEDVGKAVAWLGDATIVTGGHATVIKHRQDPKYLAYWFQSDSFRTQKRALATGTKVIDVSARQLAKVLIPLPPIEMQREIVKILDHLSEMETQLGTELEAELEARRHQYAFYRDELFVSDSASRADFVALGDLAGAGFFVDGDWVESKDQDPDGGVRLTQLADVGVGVFRDRSNRWMREDQASRLGCTLLRPGDVLIARMPDPLGRACQVPANIGRAVTVVDVAILRSDRSDVDPRYVMHAINAPAVHRQILSFQTGGTRQRISRRNLGSVRLPLPRVEEQRRIATALDNFDEILNDLNLGLEAELMARRQQYGYYREKFLTFPEATA